MEKFRLHAGMGGVVAITLFILFNQLPLVPSDGSGEAR